MTGNQTSKQTHVDAIHGADYTITTEILKRDRWQVRFWTTLAVISWLLVAALFAVTQWTVLVLLQPRLLQIWTEPDALTEMNVQELRHNLGTFYQFLTTTSICWAAMLLIAAAITIKLVGATRRATLRKIQSDLAAISTQLHRFFEQSIESTD